MLLPNNKLCIAILQLKILYTHLKGSINKASAIASPPTPPQHFRLVVGNYDGSCDKPLLLQGRGSWRHRSQNPARSYRVFASGHQSHCCLTEKRNATSLPRFRNSPSLSILIKPFPTGMSKGDEKKKWKEKERWWLRTHRVCCPWSWVQFFKTIMK